MSDTTLTILCIIVLILAIVKGIKMGRKHDLERASNPPSYDIDSIVPQHYYFNLKELLEATQDSVVVYDARDLNLLLNEMFSFHQKPLFVVDSSSTYYQELLGHLSVDPSSSVFTRISDETYDQRFKETIDAITTANYDLELLPQDADFSFNDTTYLLEIDKTHVSIIVYRLA